VNEVATEQLVLHEAQQQAQQPGVLHDETAAAAKQPLPNNCVTRRTRASCWTITCMASHSSECTWSRCSEGWVAVEGDRGGGGGGRRCGQTCLLVLQLEHRLQRTQRGPAMEQ
jgi:hypothetical protein